MEMIKVVKSNCTFAEYKREEGNTPFGNVSLCKTEEINPPDFLIICTNELRNVLGDYQALIKNNLVTQKSSWNN